MTEAAAVTENGRISPEDLGIWSDAHMKALVPIVDFIHSQGTRAGIQLSHAGRKASTMAMWLDASTIGPALSTHVATTEKGNGWTDVVAPSAIPYLSGSYPQPRAMTIREIEDLKTAWGEAVVRADQAGQWFCDVQ
jgi:2,4-dienoyl-CoA reductase-like NADH-dependent reductase (Old Yellow Enzyme family)